ncbi:response regulator transcription factor [Neobacillus sp. SAB-20_R2A]|uniref:response regulator transcription factor n=1 Tax=Neobacillus sp. SAB-20_R2A TaxID=3120519 RepID=UPI003C6DFC2C
MYGVVLVDDDVIVIEFLKKMIPWQDYGFEVVAHFQDSSLAYVYMQENSYDVLITDIGMPKLTGIELIEHLKKSNSNSYHVILSCHDEFRFAQQALKLEVYDYILKETMEEMNIIALLERLKKKLDQERHTSNQHLKVTTFLERNNIKSKFIANLMKEQNLVETDWWEEHEQLLGMDFTHEHYTPILCFIDQYQKVINHFENESLLQFNVNNVVEEVLTKAQKVQTFYLKGVFLILIPLNRNKTMDTNQFIELMIKEMHRKIGTILNISITSFIGEQNVKHQQLIENIQLLLKNKDQRFYYQHGSILYFRPISYTSDSIFHDYVQISQKLKELILKDKKDQIVESLYHQLNNIKEKKYSPAVIKDWANKLIFDIKLCISALKHFETQSNTSTDHFIQDVETFEHLECVLEELCGQFLEQVKSINLTTRNKDVLKAQKYVQTHLSEKISLKEVADHLHLNASYFSRMFKKEMGEGFIEYVTRVKMEKAIELLDHSVKSVEQIAFELGFESKSYFLKTFKKNYGFSPKSYKYKD